MGCLRQMKPEPCNQSHSLRFIINVGLRAKRPFASAAIDDAACACLCSASFVAVQQILRFGSFKSEVGDEI
jgi:hypothetical protein